MIVSRASPRTSRGSSASVGVAERAAGRHQAQHSLMVQGEIGDVARDVARAGPVRERRRAAGASSSVNVSASRARVARKRRCGAGSGSGSGCCCAAAVRPARSSESSSAQPTASTAAAARPPERRSDVPPGEASAAQRPRAGVLPTVARDSIAACASAARSSGKRWPITGRSRPAAASARALSVSSRCSPASGGRAGRARCCVPRRPPRKPVPTRRSRARS